MNDREVVFITGASSGIGAATARRLAAPDRPVVLLGRRADPLTAVADDIVAAGGIARAVVGDVTSDASVGEALEVVRELGRLQVLVANAGVMPLAPLEDTDLEDWRRTIDVNLTGVVRCLHAALPDLLAQRRGDIILISSTAGRQLFPETTVYAATKAAVNHLGECLRADLARRTAKSGGHLRVGVIEPGIVMTELFDSINHADMRSAVRDFVEDCREPLTPEDVADAVAWMVSTPPHVSINDVVIRPTAMSR